MPLSNSAEAPPRTSSSTTAKDLLSTTTDSTTAAPIHNLPDLVCFAHLHWDFVWQRPQHLLSRFAQQGRVFYVEEPFIHHDQTAPDFAHIEVKDRQHDLKVVVAHLPAGLSEDDANQLQAKLLSRYFAENKIDQFVAWYYTPMALPKSRHLQAAVTIYDCMDELANFKFAPPKLRELEQELFERADLVFTGGQSLYEAKSKQHNDAHAFPSSIDKDHFGLARTEIAEPADQASIPSPRVGFFGVVDERLDIELLGQLAEAHPEWQFVVIGPVVKIDPATLPSFTNIHYLGGKDYKELPSYLRGWDVATLLFADNESTKFISPTKTPEYLAAGKPVVSTPIRDVVRPYGDLNLVQIAATAEEFGKAIEKALEQRHDADWRSRTDVYLDTISWDLTWQGMVDLMQKKLNSNPSGLNGAGADQA
ncbi:glycosyltransferase family 1 protein [Hymenobacter jejuensis]|uniref:Glycosyltransferase family 1 protein n=1 Tax=Hymenobacter jejuensis TaxID=2502781 RepID=A0A5B8A0F6_9BACT|nr:glycosyltransferase family 1 protein [Hymenobacter jejuensis]QDA60770.1 glycosyltransferase family 1 protein [Hymenobacter jejuensis]